MATPQADGVEYRALHTVRAPVNNASRMESLEDLRKKNAYAYTIACILGEKGRQSLIETGDLEAMLDGGIVNFYQKYSKLTKGLNLQLSTPEIRFEDMAYTVKVPIKSADTVGRKFGHLFKSLAPSDKNYVKKQVLHPMSGIIKPGSTTLVLGPPGSGKTSFLKALAGKLKTEKTNVFSGSLLYSGLTPQEVQLPKFVGLVDQTDDHCPTLTVRETIQFADYCLNGNHENQPDEVRGIAALRTDLLLHILGLTKQADTVVGDELLRGVSGGEKKRVTIGEMLVGGQSIFLCDEISTGLDSAATFDITQSLKSWAEILGGTVVAALLQPPPEVVDLFDNVILLAEGRLVYHGPRERCLSYFNGLGYEIHSKLDPAEFWIECSASNAAEFERHFKNSEFSELLSTELQKGFELPTLPTETVAFREYYALTKLAGSKKKSAFALSFYDSFRLLCQRQSRVLFRDRSLFYGRMGEAFIMGFLLGAAYWNATSTLYLRMLFFSVAILQRQAWQQIPIAFQLRAIFYKQRSRNFYPTLAFGIAEAVVQIPINIVIALVMGIPFYFMSGLAVYFVNFLTFVITFFAFQHAIGAYFTFLTSVAPSMTVAQALAGCSVCFFLLFSGNIILADLIPQYWIWVYWFDPLSWALRCLMVNEFYSNRYSSDVGRSRLDSYQIHYGYEYAWYGVIVLLSYFVGFTLLKSFCLGYFSFESGKRSTDLDNRNDDKVLLNVTNEKSCPHFTPCYLSIRNLGYYVPTPTGEKVLLSNITAHFSPGTMTALMGASGAGKSTLLDVIAGRKTAGTASGEILINGLPKDVKTFPRIAAYCEQMDIHSAGVTVIEALMFSAMLRLPPEMDHEDKLALVEETIDVLGLRDILKNIVATVKTGGISVEQRKRLTVGVELVANPSILFLDEPTSGLDSRSAVMVMEAVKNIAKMGKTIICTIHQPNTQLFYLFDSILLLRRGGRIVYFGHLEEESKNMLDYFAAIPNTPRMPPKMNPATYILETIGAGIGREVKDAVDYAEVYDASDLRRLNDEKTNAVSQPSYHKEQLPELKPIATGLFNQIKECTIKTTKIYWRSTNYNFVRIVLFPFFALIFGTTFYQLGISTQAKVTSQIALIYLTMDFVGVLNMMTVLEITCAERAVFYRERMSNMYSPFPYAVGLFVAELPYLLVISGVFVQVNYWLVGMNAAADSVFFYWFVFFLYVAACTFVGQWMCALVPNAKVANVAVGAISCLFNLFSGFLIFLPKIPVYFKWITYILPSRYALSSLVSSQLAICSSTNSNGCKNITIPSATTNGSATNVSISSWILATYDFNPDDRFFNAGILIVMWAFLQIAIYLTLRFVSHLKR